MNIGAAVASDLSNVMTDFSVAGEETEGPSDQEETSWTNDNWAQYLGYYKEIPELNSVIDARATWTVGKGFKADEITTMTLDTIKGWGKDTFNTIIENLIRSMWIGGDGFAEIIRDDEGNLVNLKPLDPGSIKIIVNRDGTIKRYEQMSKVKMPDKKFKPEDIFHLARNRIADEIHGTSVVRKLEKIILMRNEAMADYQKVMHRFVKPRWIFKLDTDDTTKITAFKAKMDKANEDGENMYLPMGAAEQELMAVPPNATLNPQAWIDSLNDYFYEAAETPKFIIGNSKGFTEAGEKISYLAFQQVIEEAQLQVEEECLSQLNIVIELEFPASLENELLSDQKKDGDMTESKPSETTAGKGQ